MMSQSYQVCQSNNLINVDIDNKNNYSSNDISLFTKKKKDQWGIEGYYVPNNDWFQNKPKTFWSKGKKENEIEYQAKKKKDLPAPNTYQMSYDWNKN